MRLFGHPVHVMLVHFAIGLWPAHFALHLFASRLPAGVGVIAFWLLVAGTALAWLAAMCGAADLIRLAPSPDRRAWRSALTHGVINGTALSGFTVLAIVEYAAFPDIRHGAVFLAAEGALLALMFAGNYFGGAVVWAGSDASPSPQ